MRYSHLAIIAAALFLLAGCTTEYKDCCQKKYALVYDGAGIQVPGSCVLENGTNYSTFFLNTICEAGEKNWCNLTNDAPSPPALPNETIPICADSVPMVCVQESCKAMVCGRWSYSGTPTASMQDVQNRSASNNLGGTAPLDSSGGGGTVGLYEAQCKMLPVTRKTYNKIKGAKGGLWVNSFRFGIGSSFDDFDKMRYVFPISDSLCAANPDAAVDRYMNYYSFIPNPDRCKNWSTPITYYNCSVAPFPAPNYTDIAACNSGCAVACSPQTGGRGYECNSNKLLYAYNANGIATCKSYCPLYKENVCPSLAPSNLNKLPFLCQPPASCGSGSTGYSGYYYLASTYYYVARNCGSDQDCHWTWNGGMNFDWRGGDYAALEPAGHTEIDDATYKKLLQAQYQSELWSGHVVPGSGSTAMVSGAPYECMQSNDCMSGYCSTDYYRRFGCLPRGAAANDPREIDCECYKDVRDNKLKCAGRPVDGVTHLDLTTFDMAVYEVPTGPSSSVLGYSIAGKKELIIDDTVNPTDDWVYAVPGDYSQPRSATNPLAIPFINNCSLIEGVHYTVEDYTRYGNSPHDMFDDPSKGPAIYIYLIRFLPTLITDSGTCQPANGGSGPGPEVRLHGWCEPCTYATIAVSSYTGGTTTPYCPALKMYKDANGNVVDVEYEGHLDKTVNCDRCRADAFSCWDEGKGTRCNFAGGAQVCEGHGWPDSVPESGYLKSKIDAYLKANVMVILDDGGGGIGNSARPYYANPTETCSSYDEYGTCWSYSTSYDTYWVPQMTVTGPPFQYEGAIVHTLLDENELVDLNAGSGVYSWDGDGMTVCGADAGDPASQTCPEDLTATRNWYKFTGTRSPRGVYGTGDFERLYGRELTKLQLYRLLAFKVKEICPNCILAIKTHGGYDLERLRTFFEPYQIGYGPMKNNAQADSVDLILSDWQNPLSGSEAEAQASFDSRITYGRILLGNISKPTIIWKFDMPSNDAGGLAKMIFKGQRDLTSAGILGIVQDNIAGLRNDATFCSMYSNSSRVTGTTPTTLYTKIVGSDTCYCQQCATDDKTAGRCGGKWLLTANGAECTRPEEQPLETWDNIVPPATEKVKDGFKAPPSCLEGPKCDMCKDTAGSINCVVKTSTGSISTTKALSTLTDDYMNLIASIPNDEGAGNKRCCLNSTDAANRTMNYTYVKIEGNMQNNELDIYPSRGERGVDCGKSPDVSPEMCGITISAAEEKVDCQ